MKNGFNRVEIYYDYEGIEKWVTGAWKCKKEHTKQYADAMRSWGSSIDIRFCKVAAHTNVKYNELADKGDDEDFYKEAYRMIALKTAPFYAFRNSSFALSTLDGIRIDTHSHPIDENCEPFEGVYVLGDCSGSFFAHSYPNLVTGYAHGRTMTFARRIAAEINGEEVKDYTIMAK